MIEFTDCDEAKDAFWNIWKKNKVNGLGKFDVEQFESIVSFFSKNFNELDVFGKFQGFVAKILTRYEIKMCSKGYAYLSKMDEEFAHRVSTCEDLWNAAN